MTQSTLTRNANRQQVSGLVIALAFASFIVLGFPAGLSGIAWPSIRKTFGLAQDSVGALLLAAQIGYITSSFLSGWFTTRFGNGQLLVIGASAATLGLLGYAVAPVWALMVAVGVLVGFGGARWMPP